MDKGFSKRLMSQIDRTEDRYFERTNQIRRESSKEAISEGDIVRANARDSERVLKRMQRKGCSSEFASELMEMAKPDRSRAIIAAQQSDQLDAGLERLLGENNLISVNFLTEGAAAAASIGRIHIRDSSGHLEGFGTGFLISPNLIMTNNHVLADNVSASNSSIEFNYELDFSNNPTIAVSFGLSPDRFFATSKPLDYTIVAVEIQNEDGRRVDEFRWPELRTSGDTLIRGEVVNIIQHPGGSRKQVALRDNRIVDILDGDEFIHYEADTEPGSSGSAVYNDDWELVALHHAGVPKRNSDDQILSVDGRVWKRSMGAERIAWVANEGVLIAAILNDIQIGNASGSESTRLLNELFNTPSHRNAATTSPAAAPPQTSEISLGVGELVFRRSDSVNLASNAASESASYSYDPTGRVVKRDGFGETDLAESLDSKSLENIEWGDTV